MTHELILSYEVYKYLNVYVHKIFRMPTWQLLMKWRCSTQENIFST